MISRLQVMAQLKELKNYKFVSYHNAVSKGIHKVSLRVEDFGQIEALRHICIREFLVFEEKGYLSATSVCGRIHIERLT